jgi:hypothetical protein
MSKIEIDLKDDFKIIEDGCRYHLPEYEVIEGEGLKLTEGAKASNGEYYKIPMPVEIRFVRGSKLGSDDVKPKKGTLHEHLLKMMIHDLNFKNKLVPSRETSLAITKLEEAYNFLLQRQISRVKEGTLNTYKK